MWKRSIKNSRIFVVRGYRYKCFTYAHIYYSNLRQRFCGKRQGGERPALAIAIVFIGFQVLLGYIILRDKNDKTTRISVILAVFFSVNPGYVLVFVLRLIMRNTGNPEKIRKYWFAPAIVVGIQGLISLCSDFNFATFIYLVSSTANCLIFGYWLIKYLKLNE